MKDHLTASERMFQMAEPDTGLIQVLLVTSQPALS